MKYTFIGLFLYFLSSGLQAGLYKGLDENGNVVYSDKPFQDAKEISPPSISVVNPTAVPKKTEAKPATTENTKSDTATKYRHLGITSPKNQQTIWNNKSFTVTVTASPDLNTGAGDYLQLLVDGKTVVKKTRKRSISVGYIERGQHRLQAMIRNRQGKVIKRSKAVTVHIKHTVKPKKQPRAQ